METRSAGGGASPDVVVAGAGMVGAAVAYALSEAGARVTLLDAGEPGRGTSASSFAWVNANDKPPLAYHCLNAAGVGAHRRLAERLGGAPWLHGGGGLELAGAAGREALVERVTRLRSWGYRIDLLDLADVPALEPHLVLDDLEVAALALDEGWVDAPRCVAAMVDGAVRLGAIVRARTAVTGIRTAGERVVGVTVAGGETIAAPAVVLTAGRWTDGLARLAGLDLPLAPTCGLLAVTGPVAGGVSRVVHVPGMNFRPDPSGGYVIQSGPTDGTVTAETAPDPALPGCATLLAQVARYLPALAGGRIVEARVGVRPMPADGFTLAGPVGARPGLFVAVTHSGVTLGPLLGELVAGELTTGEAPALLADFRPERLVRPLASAPL